MFKGFIKKADIILLAVLVVIGITSSVYLTFSKSSGETVKIKLNGELYASYSLTENRVVEISENGMHNTVVIKDGKVKVSKSDCANQVCVRHSEIKSGGESIVCLPHKLVVSIESSGGDKYDTISS